MPPPPPTGAPEDVVPEPPEVEGDVPAAVVCARCGDADCPGCITEVTLSRVVAVLPWERAGGAVLPRLWRTARLATLEGERFFEALPTGPVSPALSFAVASELLAVGSVIALLVAAALLCAPGPTQSLLLGADARGVRLLTAAVPALAGLLVAAHVVHALALDRGARRGGARAAGGRALRFGLYACAWDLCLGPLGIVVLLSTEGPKGVARLLSAARGIPERCSRAWLAGAYRLHGEEARTALRAGWVGAAAATVIAALVIVAGATSGLAWILLAP